MKIKDICTSITDGSHNPPQGISESNFLMLSSKNVFDDYITTDEPRYLSKEDYERENKRTRIQPGDVLLTIVGTVGRAAVVPNDISPFALQRSVAVLHPKTDICSSRFLMYALRSKRTYIENSAKGVAQKGIYLGEVASIDLPVPSMKQQAEIIDTLDRTNAVIRKRQQQLQAFDTLIKARFVEMFGDPNSNPKGWIVDALGQYMTVLTDFSANGSYELLDSNVVMRDEPDYAIMVRTTDLELGNLKTGVKYIDQHAYELLSKSKLYGGELIMNKIGSAGKIYVMPKINRPASLGRNAFMFRFDDRINITYLYAMLTTEYGEKEIQQHVRGAVTKTITKDATRSIRIIVPPIELQNQFASFVSQVDKSKVVVQKALDEAQLLYNSLMQQYFG